MAIWMSSHSTTDLDHEVAVDSRIQASTRIGIIFLRLHSSCELTSKFRRRRSPSCARASSTATFFFALTMRRLAPRYGRHGRALL